LQGKKCRLLLVRFKREKKITSTGRKERKELSTRDLKKRDSVLGLDAKTGGTPVPTREEKKR